MTDILEKKIAFFVENQFPDFYKEEGPRFIEFVRAYFDWLEQDGQPIEQMRNHLANIDIDTTVDDFVDEFVKQYMYSIPSNILGDKRFLIKHILDIYRSKGSIQGYKLLFRLLYNEDITVYIPSNDILRASDAIWYEPFIMEVTDSPKLANFVGQTIIGSTTGAEAFVEEHTSVISGGRICNVLYVTNIYGEFSVNEYVIPKNDYGVVPTYTEYPKITGSVVDIDIVSGGPGFQIGDTLKIDGNMGSYGIVKVSDMRSSVGSLVFNIQDGGELYSTDAVEIITRNSSNTIPRIGYGASFDIKSLASVKELTYDNSMLIDSANLVLGDIANNTLGSYMDLETKYFGKINSLENVRSGFEYAISPTITVRDFIYSNQRPGTISVTNSNTQVIGVGTSFKNDFVPHINNMFLYTDNIGGHWTSTGLTKQITGVLGPNGIGSFINIVESTANVAHYISHPSIAVDANTTYCVSVYAKNPSTNLGKRYMQIIFTGTSYSTNPRAIFDLDTGIMTGSFGIVGGAIYCGNDIWRCWAAATSAATGSVSIQFRGGVSSTNYTTYAGDGVSGVLIYGAQLEVGSRPTEYQSITNVYPANSYIQIINGANVEHRIVKSVSNNTHLVLDDYASVTASGLKYKIAAPTIKSNFTVYGQPPLYSTNGTLQGENERITALAISYNDVIGGAKVKNCGFGYTQDDIVSLKITGVVDRVDITRAGIGYSNTDIIEFHGGFPNIHPSGHITTDNNGKIVDVTVDDPGAGFQTVPMIIIKSETGSGGVLSPVLGDRFPTYLTEAKVVLGPIGRLQGRFKNTNSFLNSDKYLQDSYYYQVYSYEIQSSQNFNQYKEILKNAFHVSGTEMFGKVVVSKDIEVDVDSIYEFELIDGIINVNYFE